MATLQAWQIEDLLALVRLRYPGWADFAHPPFVADELNYKQEAAALAQELLGAGAVAELLGQWQYDELLSRLERLGRETNMLWLRVPRQSDLNILYQAGVDRAELARQLARLWHGEAPLSERVQTFGEYAVARGLPLKWPFIT
jgi:hypothetical protein